MFRTRRPCSGFAALRLCFDAKSGVKLSLCLVFTATLHTFNARNMRHSLTAALRLTTDTINTEAESFLTRL